MALSVNILIEAQKFEETFRTFERGAADTQNIEKVTLSHANSNFNPTNLKSSESLIRRSRLSFLI